MKSFVFYKSALDCKTDEEVFKYLIDNIIDSIYPWSYYVDWRKVYSNVATLEKDLNLLNYLIGKDDDFEKKFISLFIEHPSLVRTLPILLACRDREIRVLTDFSVSRITSILYEFPQVEKLPNEKANEYYKLVVESGLLSLFMDKRIKNFVDYVIGVEVGLDSNGRKNRGGTAMECIVGKHLKEICTKYECNFIAQATASKIQSEFGIKIEIDRTNRAFDFAINYGEHLILIETNYYSGGGSKLKSTAGEYKSLHDFVVRQGHQFVWVTDGRGWNSTQRALKETFEHIDFLFNIRMLQRGALEALIDSLHK